MGSGVALIAAAPLLLLSVVVLGLALARRSSGRNALRRAAMGWTGACVSVALALQGLGADSGHSSLLAIQVAVMVGAALGLLATVALAIDLRAIGQRS